MPERQLLDRLRDLSDQAIGQSRLSHTSFLSPAQQAEAEVWLNKNRIAHAFSGGYDGAERQMGFIFPEQMADQDLNDHDIVQMIHALDLKAPVRSAVQLSHRDYLGSLLALGIRREQIGDILVRKNGATVLMTAAMASFVESHLERVGSLQVSVTSVALTDIAGSEKNSELLRITVTSPRLDKIAASGFSIARTQMVDLIRSGAVQVNWQEELHPDRVVTIGSMISLRGLGRICLKEEEGYSRKKKKNINLERLL